MRENTLQKIPNLMDHKKFPCTTTSLFRKVPKKITKDKSKYLKETLVQNQVSANTMLILKMYPRYYSK